MRNFESFEEFARHLQKVQRALPKEIEKCLKDTGTYAVRKAKGKIGNYQADFVTPQGEWFPEWPDLAYSTLYGGVSSSGYRYQGKIELGYSPPDNPLLRKGDLQNSIQFSLSGTWAATEVTLGSTSQVMVWQEFGTVIIPPRSVIGASMAETVQEMHLKRLREAVERAFAR